MKLNITWHGACPSCGIETSATGYRADPTPDAFMKLGTYAETVIRCPVCSDDDITLMCVGICLEPFVAREQDPED